MHVSTVGKNHCSIPSKFEFGENEKGKQRGFTLGYERIQHESLLTHMISYSVHEHTAEGSRRARHRTRDEAPRVLKRCKLGSSIFYGHCRTKRQLQLRHHDVGAQLRQHLERHFNAIECREILFAAAVTQECLHAGERAGDRRLWRSGAALQGHQQ